MATTRVDAAAAAAAAAAHKDKKDVLVWIDMEMTGLEPDTDLILEIAVIVTDSELNILAEGPDVAIYQPDSVLDAMNDWCKVHHAQSGLVDRVRASTINVNQAEELVLEFVKKYCDKGKAPLAGNTVHQDKRFLYKYMPTFANYLHYRIVDVSTVKELCRYWYPKDLEAAPLKAGSCLLYTSPSPRD
eukprot:TRINITY_DN3697_c0_g1_i3.p1 TRINITY_DN3697_c0_g1~~TRINITY_DN3697_c0_g1_i3.p1  ORF type:complete len:201 (-),score=48.12 TRINITY_DN3697_c0_g1_i3:29-589(-)